MPKSKNTRYQNTHDYTRDQLMEDAELIIELAEGTREMFHAAYPCGCPDVEQCCRHEDEALEAVLRNPDGWEAMRFILGLFASAYPRVVSDDLLGRFMDQRHGAAQTGDAVA